jgi:hypothetical protein
MDMPMRSAVPDWLTPVAWTYIALSLLSAAVIAFDIYLRRHRQLSVATELVWMSSALYLGPFAIAAYRRYGRSTSMPPTITVGDSERTALAALPGGGASAVAHLIAVPFVAATGWTIAGMDMWPMILVIAVLATAMLTAYELVVGRSPKEPPERGVSPAAALMVASITVVAFDVGMVGWMLVLHFNNLMPPVTEGTFWFLMQLGVVIGLVTAYPAVRWLLDRNQTPPLVPAG